MTESSKIYYSKKVGERNEKGCFSVYKRVVERMSQLIIDLNPSFTQPKALISTVIEASHQQRYFMIHLPELTDIKTNKDGISDFFTQLVFKTITTHE
jgi:hypothetical protein